ncbi:MAG TPA: Tol-Pal system beta propeller repeat protein TolB [Sphingobium sp.]
MTRTLFSTGSTLALLLTAAGASAQTPAPKLPTAAVPSTEQGLSGSVTDETNDSVRIAIPAMPTQADVNTPAGSTASLGARIAEVIASDLKNSGLFQTIGPAGTPAITIPEVTAPAYDRWSGIGAEALVQGFIRSAGGDADITVGCYLFDVSLKTEQTRLGYVVAPKDWRRAAHKCADAIYARLTGESPFFDSRIAYIAETGPKDARVKRLAIMDSDGANHRFITNGQSIALTPRFSPDYKSIAYVSYVGRRVRIYTYDIGAGTQKLVTESSNAVFAPRWSPDGRSILYSMASSGNTDIYKVSASGGGTPVRLTNTPGINVGGSFSPDGTRIVFESDRSGKQQIYVMDASGGNQQRISFGGGSYATPEWSPRGDLIAFTRLGSFNIGVMTPGGQGERILTHGGWQDEAPSWSPNGRVLQFFRTSQGKQGKSEIWQVDLTGVNERRIPTPVDGSDPAWGPLLP